MITNDELQTAFRLYYDNIYNLCYKCLDHVENAEDIAISSFVEVCDRRETLNFSEIKGYLIVTAKSKIVDLQRRNKIWRKVVKKMPKCDSLYCMPDLVDVKKMHNSVLSAMEQLPPKMKRALELMYIEGYNRNEVAKITETSPNTVRNTIVTALSKLKQLVPCDE